MRMEEKSFWPKVRKYLINKYAITLCLFALLLLFMGDNSLIQYVKRAVKMREVKEELQVMREETAKSQSVLETLDNTDSLERFAREQYRMHAPNEDVYVVE
jgi:cell division protein FtsB